MPGVIGFALALLLLAPASAHADLRDLVGKPLSAVVVEVLGAPVIDPELLSLIETRVGETLALERVRETVDHFVGLGRFDDVRVFGRLVVGAAGESVELRWALTPVQRVTRIAFDGSPRYSEGELRAALQTAGERQPTVDRIPVLLDRLRSFYAERGYHAAELTSRLVPDGPAGAELRIAIAPGAQARVSSLDIDAPASIDLGEVRERLDLRVGGTYDRADVERRADELQTRYRDRGFFEAGVTHAATNLADGAVAVKVTVDPGPRVRLEFAGDLLDPGLRDELVPIQRERSVDDDLLEDAARNIERFLRSQGYRDATVRSERSENDDELLITFTVTRGALHRLTEIDVQGASAISLTDLTPLTALALQAPYVDERAAAVDAALTELYRRRGFAAALVEIRPTIGALIVGDQSEPFRPVDLELRIEEGPQTLVEQVTVEGAAEIPQAKVREVLGLSAGAPFYQPQLTADRDAITQLYRDEGFEQVAVSAATQPTDAPARVGVRFTVAEGTQTRVDRLLVSGTRRIGVALVRRETGLIEGQPLRDGALVDAQRRLALLGLFRRVRVSELPAGAGAGRDILIEVEEAPASTIAYGGGLELEPRFLREGTEVPEERLLIAPRAFFEVGRQNLGGKNRSINLFTRASLRRRDPGLDAPNEEGGYGLNEYRVVGTFREPRLFDTPGDAQLTAFLEQAIRTGFSFRRRGIRADYARRLASAFTVGARYTFDRTRLYDSEIAPDDPDQPLIDRLFPQVRLSTLTGSVLRDSRDDVLDPRRGTVLGVDGSLAAPAIGSEVGFARSLLQAFAYRRLPGTTHFVLVAGARLGLAKGFAVEADGSGDFGAEEDTGAPTDLPASERFFAGGDTTVRGFALDRLGTDGTLNADGFPIGGNGLVVFNLEVRAPYWKNISAVTFVDVGNVYRRVSDVNLDDLRTAAGFGVRYRSPIGPLRVDLGFKLDPRTLSSGAREQRAVFHLSLGQAF